MRAELAIIEQIQRLHDARIRRYFRVAKLANIEMPFRSLRPAEENIACRLHQPLTDHHALTVMLVDTPPDKWLDDRCTRLLELEK